MKRKKAIDNKFRLTTLMLLLSLFVSVLVIGCSSQEQGPQIVRLATTTSTYDSGLLDYIIPDFEEEHNAQVEIISVGTGQAIKNGEQGNVDIILVHAPAAEKAFVKEGNGVDRRCVMYNDFIILGPETDPAGITGKPVTEALWLIMQEEQEFISRGDDSGTHKKEISLWQEIGLPSAEWYLETGSGMGDTLRIANEKLAYTLADRGTYISQKDSLDLVVLVEGDEKLLNPYGVIRVNPENHEGLNEQGALQFADWIMSEDTQEMISAFRKNGEVLFKPLDGVCMGE